MSHVQNIVPVTSFYDVIAPAYDGYLTSSADNVTRQFVSNAFKEHVPANSNVLDFGGGTGLDLPWLLSSGYRVFFLEPSANMRAIAKNIVMPAGAAKPFYVDESTDLAQWSAHHLPFQEKMDGIIANFAVLNCMENIGVFFEKAALLCNKGCHLFALVINPQPLALLKNYSAVIAARMLFRERQRMLNDYEGISHEVFIHSLASYRGASRPYFNLMSCTPVRSSNFALLLFSRK